MNNQILFFVVFVIAILHLIGYISRRNWNSVFFFLLVAIITHYFSRNATIVLLVALISTNFYRASNRMQPKKEAMTGRREGMSDEEEDDEDDDLATNILNAENMTGGAMASLEGLKDMGGQLASAKQQQESMVELLNKMGPLVKESMNMLENLPTGTMEKLTNHLSKAKSS